MANTYDTNADQEIAIFRKEYSVNNAFLVQIMSYNNGPRRIQFNRTYDKDGVEMFKKVGRIDVDEMKWMKENMDKIIEMMEAP